MRPESPITPEETTVAPAPTIPFRLVAASEDLHPTRKFSLFTSFSPILALHLFMATTISPARTSLENLAATIGYMRHGCEVLFVLFVVLWVVRELGA
ncbi:hypothetical protein C8R45DRAFT_1037904 [Mycena sanguinolenta]|nr:hypothetical protein C8R45DRAFT_1037904 [Mycena sanguinolenta]